MDRVLFSSQGFDWLTPPAVLDFVWARFGPILFDPAAQDGFATAPFYLTPAEDGLKTPWPRGFCLGGCGPYRVDFKLAHRLPKAMASCLRCGAGAWDAGDGLTFLNPPYGRAVGRWVEKALDEAGQRQVVLLLASRTDTAWFARLFGRASELVFITGRLKFARPDGRPAAVAPFGSLLALVGPETPLKPRVEVVTLEGVRAP